MVFDFSKACYREAGAQQCKPAIDRQSLEKALEFFYNRNEGPNTATVIDAARAYLDTLPKGWRVTSYSGEQSAADGVFHDYDDALAHATRVLEAGHHCVSIVVNK